MATMPTDLTYGKVVGRLILAIADGIDADRTPDASPATGSVEFAPKAGLFKRQSPPTSVVPTKISCSFDSDGHVIDAQGATGIWLVTGVYTVNYKVTGAVIQSHDIEVLPEHTDSNPLDLTNSIPPGGPVLLPSQYAELSARIDAIDTSGGGGGGTAPDATTTTKGLVQLAGDLGGTATAPTVPGLASKVPTTRTVNGKPLSADIELGASDVGAATAAQGAKADTAVQPGSLATVATTGAYADLSGRPTLGTAASKDVGTAADTVAAGDDARLSDARTPTAHAASHKTGGTDPLASGDIGAAPLRSSLNAQTGTAYTLALSDEAKLVTLTNAAATTLTVPANATAAFPLGCRIDLAVLGAGMVTVTGASGVTIRATPSLTSRAQYSAMSLLKVATDTWLLVGDLA